MSEFTESNYGINWTLDDADYRYRNGRISQDEWEAFNALHPASCRSYGPPYANLRVVEMISATGYALEAAGRPLEQPDRAVANLRVARRLLAKMDL